MAVYISIIIPSFNSGKTIKKAIQSIIKQGFEEFEVLVIDGESSDNTIKEVKSLSDTDKRIKWISEKDQGVYDAMNKGIKMSKGTWLYFLGSDDYFFADDVLEKVVEEITEYGKNYDLVYGDAYSPIFNGTYDGEFDLIKISQRNLCHQSVFYNRKVFDKEGFYNLKYKIMADYEFNLRCFFNSQITTIYINVTVAYYSDGGLSSLHVDQTFFQDYHNLIKKLAYKKLPLKQLKSHCSSNYEFIKLLLKRLLSQ